MCRLFMQFLWSPTETFSKNKANNSFTSKMAQTLFDPEVPTELFKSDSTSGFGKISDKYIQIFKLRNQIFENGKPNITGRRNNWWFV